MRITFCLSGFLCLIVVSTRSSHASSKDLLYPVEQRRIRHANAYPTPAPTTSSSSSNSRSKESHQQHSFFYLRWSLVFPVLSMSFMAWALRFNANRCVLCCGDTTDAVPDEILVPRDDGSSVVGDRMTDIELQSVDEWPEIKSVTFVPSLDMTLRHEWPEDRSSITGYASMSE